MNHLGLTVAGFAIFIDRETSHIYGILNVSRDFSDALAEHIGKLTGIKGATIKNINTDIPSSISKCDKIVEFRKSHKDNKEYFLNTKTDRSIDAFISDILVKANFLKTPRYLSEIEEFIASKYDKNFSKDKLSKALRYAVSKETLKSEKRTIKLQNGNFGKRLVDVYWINIEE
ncbi:MAG: hypothetical protein LBE37_16790 [Sphingobacterium sp.]|jgi:glutaredoxin 2|nr:hypothetical protein [Sphingobacterium sp.]